jgi:DNA invertase Pin-like site-specific DNA recombinase
MTTLAYYLVGTDGQETKPQLEDIDETHDAVDWFTDMASNESIRALERPGFSELHNFARNGDTLVVSSLDRLGASATELLEVFQAFKAKGVGVVSGREGFDLFSSEGNRTEALLVALADLERTLSGARTTAKKRKT